MAAGSYPSARRRSAPDGAFAGRAIRRGVSLQVHQLEYALSPDGGLRAWFKLNLLLCLMLGIPLLFVVPVVTGLLTSFASWTALLLQIAINLLYTLLVVIAIGTILMFLFRGLRRG